MEFLSQLGVGGFVGAAATLWLIQARWQASLAEFRAQFEVYVASRSDPETEALKETYARTIAETKALMKAIDQLKRALRRRK